MYVYYKPLFSVDNSSSYNLSINDKINDNVNSLSLVVYITKLLKIDNLSIFDAIMYKVFNIPIINFELTFMSFTISLIIFISILCISIIFIVFYLYKIFYE